MRHVAIINQKGGVGKTSITANLGHALALLGKRVMVVDLDPQGQLSTSLGVFRPPTHGIDEVLLGRLPFEAVTIHTREGMALIPAGESLAEIERYDGDGLSRSRMLGEALKREPLSGDYVLFDCPPASGVITANALLAADEVLIPVTGDYLGLNGLAHLMTTLKRFSAFRSSPLRQWIVVSRFHARRRLSQEVLENLLSHCVDEVLATPVREAAVMAECPAVGRTIFEYRRSSRSAQDFMELARDLIEERTL